MKLYKLTDENDQTYGGCQWEKAVTHTADGNGKLCACHWLHAYEHPLLAVLHDPIHADLDPKTMHLWKCETTDDKPLREGYMKLGVRNLTTVKRIPIPKVSHEQRIAYAIHCALCVCVDEDFVDWADGWLSGKDRSAGAAEAEAAWAKAAAEAAWAAGAAEAAGAAWAAEAAGAAWAAEAARAADNEIDLLAIAKQVCGKGDGK